MNINSEYDEEMSLENAQQAMDVCMSMINRILIEPAEENDLLTEDQVLNLGSVAMALQVIAKKAHAYEKMLDINNINPYTNN